jgi:hypothetical protein
LSRAFLAATIPSSGAVSFLRTPLKLPTGVRAAETMTTSGKEDVEAAADE